MATKWEVLRERMRAADPERAAQVDALAQELGERLERVVEYSALTHAEIAIAELDRADVFDQLLDELEKADPDGWLFDPAISYDEERGRLEALFTLYVDGDLAEARRRAVSNFATALTGAGLDTTQLVLGAAVVEGGPEPLEHVAVD
jgi:hypothetical protein